PQATSWTSGPPRLGHADKNVLQARQSNLKVLDLDVLGQQRLEHSVREGARIQGQSDSVVVRGDGHHASHAGDLARGAYQDLVAGVAAANLVQVPIEHVPARVDQQD